MSIVLNNGNQGIQIEGITSIVLEEKGVKRNHLMWKKTKTEKGKNGMVNNTQ